jgi:hypothetical protein
MLLSPIPGPRPAAPQKTEGTTGKNTWQSEADTPERQVLIEHMWVTLSLLSWQSPSGLVWCFAIHLSIAYASDLSDRFE